MNLHFVHVDAQDFYIFFIFTFQASSRNIKTNNLQFKNQIGITLPETNIAPENRTSQKEISSSNHWFSGAILVSGRVPLLHVITTS